jgi:hypothetical protein
MPEMESGPSSKGRAVLYAKKRGARLPTDELEKADLFCEGYKSSSIWPRPSGKRWS